MKSSQKKILVDANVYIGFYNRDDALHERATSILLQADAFIITEQSFVEIISVLTRRVNIREAQDAGRELLARDITLLQPLQSEFDEAWTLFASQKKLSFTDCVNIVLAQNSGCTAIATFDEAYKEYSRVPILTR